MIPLAPTLSATRGAGYLSRMLYNSAEDRLNPIVPEGVDETTLGGYQTTHGRSAAFEGADGQPYTAAVETEHSGGAAAPWAAYLIFPRWAGTGTAVMDHLETGDLATGDSEVEVRAALESLPLNRIKEILDDAIRHKRSDPGF